MGNKIINSISKIKNTRDTKKKCIEKLFRLLRVGIKPHSKGLNCSLYRVSFFLTRVTRIKITKVKVNANTKDEANLNIEN